MMLINPDKFTAIVILKGLEDIKLFNIKDESFLLFLFVSAYDFFFGFVKSSKFGTSKDKKLSFLIFKFFYLHCQK